MRLEVGKTYLNRDGDKVTITKYEVANRRDQWPFSSDEMIGQTGMHFRSDGTWGTTVGVPSKFDLISEYTEPAAEQNDGWIEWSGGECPVPGDTLVEVRFFDYAPLNGIARNYRWKHKHTPAGGSDIIAYRVIEPAANDTETSEPGLADMAGKAEPAETAPDLTPLIRVIMAMERIPKHERRAALAYLNARYNEQ